MKVTFLAQICYFANTFTSISEPISRAKTLLSYNSPDDDLISFRANSEAMIYMKSAGTHADLWFAVINGKKGFISSKFLRESKVIQKPEEIVQLPQNPKLQPNKVQQAHEVVDGTTIYTTESTTRANQDVNAQSPNPDQQDSAPITNTDDNVTGEKVVENTPGQNSNEDKLDQSVVNPTSIENNDQPTGTTEKPLDSEPTVNTNPELPANSVPESLPQPEALTASSTGAVGPESVQKVDYVQQSVDQPKPAENAEQNTSTPSTTSVDGTTSQSYETSTDKISTEHSVLTSANVHTDSNTQLPPMPSSNYHVPEYNVNNQNPQPQVPQPSQYGNGAYDPNNQNYNYNANQAYYQGNTAQQYYPSTSGYPEGPTTGAVPNEGVVYNTPTTEAPAYAYTTGSTYSYSTGQTNPPQYQAETTTGSAYSQSSSETTYQSTEANIGNAYNYPNSAENMYAQPNSQYAYASSETTTPPYQGSTPEQYNYVSSETTISPLNQDYTTGQYNYDSAETTKTPVSPESATESYNYGSSETTNTHLNQDSTTGHYNYHNTETTKSPISAETTEQQSYTNAETIKSPVSVETTEQQSYTSTESTSTPSSQESTTGPYSYASSTTAAPSQETTTEQYSSGNTESVTVPPSTETSQSPSEESTTLTTEAPIMMDLDDYLKSTTVPDITPVPDGPGFLSNLYTSLIDLWPTKAEKPAIDSIYNTDQSENQRQADSFSYFNYILSTYYSVMGTKSDSSALFASPGKLP